jgi:hypothetical protein
VHRKTAIGGCQRNGIQALPKESGVKSINSAVILDGNSTDDFRLTLEYLDMLDLSKNMMCGECDECKVDVS